MNITPITRTGSAVGPFKRSRRAIASIATAVALSSVVVAAPADATGHVATSSADSIRGAGLPPVRTCACTDDWNDDGAIPGALRGTSYWLKSAWCKLGEEGASGSGPLVQRICRAFADESREMPVGTVTSNGRTWTPNYSQDFSDDAALGQIGHVYGETLRGYDGFTDTSGKGTYSPDKVLTVEDGVLDYYLHTEDGQPLVATPVVNGWQGQTYGRYSVRFRSDDLPGYKIAFLLWPSSDDWNEGEIDWPEGRLRSGEKMYATSAIKGTLSGTGMEFDPPSHAYAGTDSSDWHIATTEWAPGIVRWYWDEELVGSTAMPSGVPTTNMRWTLQAETDILGPAPAASVAGHLQVDWIVQYQLG